MKELHATKKFRNIFSLLCRAAAGGRMEILMKSMLKKVSVLILIFALALSVASCKENEGDAIYDSITSQAERSSNHNVRCNARHNHNGQRNVRKKGIER